MTVDGGPARGALADALSASRDDERRRALRGLLRRPLMTAIGPDAATFRLVRRHQAWLREWLASETGWALRVDPEVARLAKAPADLGDGTRPATSGGAESPFGRRRYVLLCLALATLERADHQITLGRLGEEVLAAATDPALTASGVTFTLERREERGDLVAAVRLLLDLGVLSRVAGHEQPFATGSGDALYDVDRRALAGLLVTRRGPSTITAGDLAARLSAAVEGLVPDSDDARLRGRRHALTRRLLDDPVVYYDELDPDELAYLTSQRAALTRRIAEATGLVPEVRAEGLAMVDPDDDLTDVRMPEVGTDGHATLLLAERLAAAGMTPCGDANAADRSPAEVSLDELYALMSELAATHAPVWRKAAKEPGAEVTLVDRAVGRLVALRLLRRTQHGVVARPALARFALGDPVLTTDHLVQGDAPHVRESLL